MNHRSIGRAWALAVMLGATALSAGCAKGSTSDIKSQFVAAPDFDASTYTTFGWAAGAVVSKDPLMAWSDSELDFFEETKFLIDEKLRQRGLTVSNEPELYVSFLLLNDTKQLKEVEAERAGELPKLAGVGEGALVIEIVDAKTGITVWLGAVTAETDSSRNTETKKKRLRYAVEELLGKLDR